MWRWRSTPSVSCLSSSIVWPASDRRLDRRLAGGQMKRRFLAATLGAALAWSGTATAQTLESAQIRGIVYDETKAALPGAAVTLTNAATGFTRTVTTNADGAYTFAQVPSGTYSMSAVLSGFAPTQVTGVVANAGSALTYDITMGLAGQKESVTVEASGAGIDTSS